MVKLTKIGSITKPRIPKINIASTVRIYPIREGLYSTIELLTQSQNGHLTLDDLKH